MTTQPQRIIRLEVEDFLRVKTASITPDGKAVVIGGNNGEGKSSLLLAVESLFGGKKHTPAEPVRKGAKKAHIIGETTDYIVEKHIRKNGDAEVEVRAKSGGIVPRPHELLSKLYDDMTFDPCVFDRTEPKKQAEILRQLGGMDFTLLDQKRAQLFAERTDVGRELKRLDGALEKLPAPPAGAPDAEASVADLLAEAERRQKVNVANAAKRSSLESMRSEASRLVTEIADAKARLEALEAKLEHVRADGIALRGEVDKLVDEDLAEVRARVATAEQTNASVRTKQARAKLEQEHSTATDEHERLTSEINAIDAQKAEAAAQAKYPIEGLEVTDEGVRLGGVPFEQASQAERLRASTAIGAALKKGLRCMLIREGAFLDERSMALLLGPIAREFDLQPFVEVVGNRSECTVIMVDGEVAPPHAERTDGRQPAAGVA